MRIVVTTPTGNVGSRVVHMLVQAGIRPVVLVRDARKVPADLVEAIEGDLTDADHVLRATEGADALYWVDPTNYGAEDPNAETVRLGETAARAITGNGIGRTVFQSSVGAEKRHGAGLIDGLAGVEQALDATGAPVLHLRCGFFFTNLAMDPDGLANGVLTTSMDADAPMPWVDPRDIGDVAAARLLAGGWSGRQVQAVHGPADLSWNDVAATLSAVLDRPVRVDTVSDDDVRDGLLAAGMPPATADGMVGMTAGLRDFTPEQPRDAVTTTPTTLGAWAWQHLR
jgi:NAD(P)H dehydrogenase (quinone)